MRKKVLNGRYLKRLFENNHNLTFIHYYDDSHAALEVLTDADKIEEENLYLIMAKGSNYIGVELVDVVSDDL